MIKTQNILFAALLIAAHLLPATRAAATETPAIPWTRFVSNAYEGALFPDTHARYWRYCCKIPSDGSVALRLRGNYPDARYMAFNIYDPATGAGQGSLPDEAIVPDGDLLNPLSKPAHTIGQRGSYTVWVLPQGAEAPLLNSQNIVRLASNKSEDGTQLVEIWYRVYLSDLKTDDRGGVSLPRLEAVNLLSGDDVALPPHEATRTWIPGTVGRLPPHSQDGSLNFYRTAGVGLFPNNDNSYLISRLEFTNEKRLAVIRFRAPRATVAGALTGTGVDDPILVRYWSLCLVGISTRTSACLSDRDAVVDEDGFVTIVVGPEEYEREVLARGLNFLPRGKLVVPFLMYRNLLPSDFPGAISRMPFWQAHATDANQPADKFAAHKYMGDYAPLGKLYSPDEFLRTYKTQDAHPLQRDSGECQNCQSLELSASDPVRGVMTDPRAVRKANSLRVGIAWSCFQGAVWHKFAFRESNNSRTNVDMVRKIEADFSRLIRERTGLEPEVSVLPVDVLAHALENGTLDVGVFPGEDHWWLSRHYQALQPLAFGNLQKPARVAVQAHVIVRRDDLKKLAVAENEGEIADLVGWKLSACRVRSHGLQFLHQQITNSGNHPEGFFTRPATFAENPEVALLNLAGRAPNGERLSRSLMPQADLVLVDDVTLEKFAQDFPEARNELALFCSSEPTPAPLLVGRPNLPEELRGTLVDGLVSTGRRQAARSLHYRMGPALGVTTFSPITPEYRTALESHAAQMGATYEYALPLFFY